MRRAIIVILLLAPACGSESEEGPFMVCGDGVQAGGEMCDDGNRVPGDGCSSVCLVEQRAAVSWEFFPMVGQPAAGCRPGVSTIEVVVERSNPTQFACGANRGEVFVETFVEPARVFARALDASGNEVASTMPRLPDAALRVAARFYEDGGFVRAFIGRPLSLCAQPVQFTITPSGGPTGVAKMLTCNQNLDLRMGVIISDGLRAGTYDVTVTTDAGPQTRSAVVGTNNAIADVDFTQP